MGLSREYINLSIKNICVIVMLAGQRKKKIMKEKGKKEKLFIQTLKSEAPCRHNIKAGFLKVI